jgi:hypothetical protein
MLLVVWHHTIAIPSWSELDQLFMLLAPERVVVVVLVVGTTRDEAGNGLATPPLHCIALHCNPLHCHLMAVDSHAPTTP